MQKQLLLTLLLTVSVTSVKKPTCKDADMNCATWLAGEPKQCEESKIVSENCHRSCEICGPPIEPKFDVRRLHKKLLPVAWLVGKWRSEFGGKAFFPTIPKFTYGEQIEISISDNRTAGGHASLNYTAFAWDINMPDDPIEIHSENGYITVDRDDEKDVDVVALTTAMSNGFMTVEEGDAGPNQIKFELVRIGRISFSHDSAVRLMFREWTLLDESKLESRLLMTTTVTRKLMEHTSIIYNKVYP